MSSATTLDFTLRYQRTPCAKYHVRPLSLLQLDFMVEGRYEAAAVVGVIVVLLTTGIALVARVFGLRVAVRD